MPEEKSTVSLVSIERNPKPAHWRFNFEVQPPSGGPITITISENKTIYDLSDGIIDAYKSLAKICEAFRQDALRGAQSTADALRKNF